MFDDWKVLEVVFKFGHVHIGTEDFAVAESEIKDDFSFVNGSDIASLPIFQKRFTRNYYLFSPFAFSANEENIINFRANLIFKLCQWQIE